jgi:hypothetical protein
MVDRVQPLKLEDTSTGGDETDQFPTALDPSEDHVECAGVVFDDATHRDEDVRVWRVGNDLTFLDVSNPTTHTLTDLLASSSGITEAEHEGLRTLVHEIDQTSYEEIVYSGTDVTADIIWTDATKVKKIREELFTYGSGHRVLQAVTIQYDAAGAEQMRMTEDYTYLPNHRVANVQKTKTGSP